MFKIIALVYVIVAGQPIMDEPAKISHRLSFNSYDQCSAFMQGEQFQIEKDALSNLFRSALEPKMKDDDDDPIDFAIAVTAGCEDDNTL